MLRTISLKLNATLQQYEKFHHLQAAFAHACTLLVDYVVDNRCWNRVALHNKAYSSLREKTVLGSQMACNAIYAVTKAYKAQKALGRIKKQEPVPKIAFRKASIHFDKRTYSFTKEGDLSLYTLNGRERVSFQLGKHQSRLLTSGVPKEAELVYRKKKWYFNLVIEIPDVPQVEKGTVMGVDVGENNLAATSTGKIFGGGYLRHTRDRFLAQRKRLQSNGTQSAKQKLCKISGSERRRVQQCNHVVSKEIIKEAIRIGVSDIVLEDLTHIRDTIRSNRRIRTRLHRWPFRQLQEFIRYKAEGVGIRVHFVNPAYSSVTCASCLNIGQRVKHRFSCSCCGIRAHADCNASQKLARIVASADGTRAVVNPPNVGAHCVP